MPVVPRISSGNVQISQAPNVQVRTQTSKENFGGGKAVQEGLSVIKQVFQEAKRDADEIAVLDADKRMSEVQSSILYNPENGVFSRKGKAAFNAIDESMTAFTQSADEIESTLTNATQKAAFRKLSMNRRDDVNRQTQRHVSAEIQQYDNSLTESYLINERDAAAQNPYDVQRINTSIANQKNEFERYATRNGLPQELREQKIRELSSSTYAGVIDKLLANGKDLDAKAYYESVKDQFTAKDATRIDKDLRTGSLLGESQRKSDEIFMKYSDSLSLALSEVKKIEDPQLREMTSDKVRQNFAYQEAARRDAAEKNNIKAANLIDAGKPLTPQMLNAMTTSERNQIMSYQKTKLAGNEPETDWLTYQNLRTMKPDEFVKIDLYGGYRNKLSNTEFKQLVDLQAGLRKGDEKSKKELDGFQTDNQVVDGILTQNGFNTSSKASKKQKEEIAQFKRLVDREKINLQAKTGKPANNNDIEEIAKKLVVKVTTEPSFFGLVKNEKPAFLITADDVPDEDREKIKASLTKRGIKVTDDRIVELYKKKAIK